MTHPQKDRRHEIIQRIMDNVVVDEETGCWVWQGRTSGNGKQHGYGRITINSHTLAVHRVVYTHYFGIIPGKKHIDHICNNRLCCNPDHLEMVSHKENHKRRVKRSKKK